jgi:replicative DNA helicase
LPVWHNLTVDDVKAYSLMLADRVGGTTSRGIDKLVDQILKALEIEARREQSLSPNFAKMEEAAAKVKQGASSLSENSDGGFKSIQELFTKSLDLVNEAFENYSGDVTGFRTGIHDLDSLILGLHKPEVTLIASRPLVGKTALALTIAHNVAIDEGLPVAYIATGYDELQFVNRMIGIDGFISTRNLENGSLTDDEWSRVVSVSVRFDDANLVFLEQSELNVKDVVDKATRLAEGFNGLLGLVVFDCNRYFDNADEPDGKQALIETFRSIKGLARALQCPILVTYPVSRAVDARIDRAPGISDLPGVDHIERYVDNIMLLKSASSRAQKNVLQVLVARQKRGPSDTVDTLIYPTTGRVVNLAKFEGNGDA